MDFPWTIQVEKIVLPARLDRYLASKLAGEQGMSRNVIHRMIEQGCVQIKCSTSGQTLTVRECDYLLRGGEHIAIGVDAQNTKKYAPLPDSIEKLYEDDSLVAISKPAGLMTHPLSSLAFKLPVPLAEYLGIYRNQNVLGWILKHYSKAESVPRFGIVHRLDAATSGVLLIAKTSPAYFQITKLFAERRVEKTYLALVMGVMPEKEGRIHLRVLKKYTRRKVRLSTHPEKGLTAETSYRLIQEYPNRPFKDIGSSFLELRPATGRTHQLRLHLSAIGHPIYGDPLYGHKLTPILQSKEKDPHLRLMLHAYKIRFMHPPIKKPLEIEAPVPKDFKREFLNHLKTPIPVC